MASPLRVRPAPGTNDPIPAMTAPQQTPLASFREGFQDFATQAASTALLGYDDEIAGIMGPMPYEEGRAAQEARVSAANERSPQGAALGDLAGNFISPAGAVAGKALSIAGKGIRAARKVAPTAVKAAPAAPKASIGGKGTPLTGFLNDVTPQQIISSKNLRRPREEIVQSAMNLAKAGDKKGEIWRHPELFDLPPATPGAPTPTSGAMMRNYDVPGRASDQVNYTSLKSMEAAQKAQRVQDRAADVIAAGKPPLFGKFGQRRITPDEPLPPALVSPEQQLADSMQLEAFLAKRGQAPDVDTMEIMRWREMRRQAEIAEQAAR